MQWWLKTQTICLKDKIKQFLCSPSSWKKLSTSSCLVQTMQIWLSVFFFLLIFVLFASLLPQLILNSYQEMLSSIFQCATLSTVWVEKQFTLRKSLKVAVSSLSRNSTTEHTHTPQIGLSIQPAWIFWTVSNVHISDLKLSLEMYRCITFFYIRPSNPFTLFSY